MESAMIIDNTRQLAASLLQQDGTWNLSDGEPFSRAGGYQVGVRREYTGPHTLNGVSLWLRQMRELHANGPDVQVGSWLSPAGIRYIEISLYHWTLSGAAATAQRHEQTHIWDWAEGIAIETPTHEILI